MKGFSVRITNQDLSAFSRCWHWLIAWGLALMLLGFFAISASTFTTLLSVIFIGILLSIAGVVVLVNAITSWRGKGKGFISHLITGILYFAAGLLLLKSPIAGSMSLTFLLGIFYLILGIFRMSYSLSLKLLNWGWGFLNGLITSLIGILIFANWPESSLFIIGLFLGIDLVFCGWSYLMSGFAARHFAKRLH